MELSQASAQLAELGHITRLGIYRALVKAGPEGIPVATVQNKLNVPASTLSHHINRLLHVGLIKQIREGRVLRCIAQYQELSLLINFLTEECCQNSSCQ